MTTSGLLLKGKALPISKDFFHFLKPPQKKDPKFLREATMALWKRKKKKYIYIYI